MAVAFDGFSIRDYTAKTRAVDVAKCWPFKLEEGEDDAALAQKLPPISVAKFRWWAHELTRLRRAESEPSAAEEPPTASSSASAAACPVCRDFAAPTLDAVHAHIDACLAAADRAASKADRRAVAAMLMKRSETAAKSSASPKAKSRPTKKRSIAEIFAVAPQIDRTDEEERGNDDEREGGVDEDDDDDDDDDEVLTVDFKMLSVSKSSGSSTGSTAKKKKKRVMSKVCKKKKKKLKRVLEGNKLADGLNKKKKRKKKIESVEGSIAMIKKNAKKFILQNHANFAKKLKKRFAMDSVNSDSVSGKKMDGKCLSTQDKQNGQEVPSRLIERINQEASPPIRSILKNHTANSEPKSTIHSLQHCSEANPCGIKISERHVRFSVEDAILGPKKNVDSHSPEQNVGNLVLDGIAASPESAPTVNLETVSVEINTSEDDTSMGTDYGAEVQPVIRREQSADIPHVEMPSSPRLPVTVQDYTRVFQEKITVSPSQSPFYDNNLHVVDESYPTAAQKPAFAGIPRLFSTIGGNAQVGGSVSRTSNCNERLINHVQDPYLRVSEITPMENTRRLPERLSCFVANENENHRIRFQAQPAEEIVTDPGLQYRTICRPGPMDLIGGLCSFPPEWKQQAVVLRERSMDGGFIGLPLNSQGELIQSSSRGKGMFIDPRETNIIGPSSSFFPAHKLTQPSLRSTADYLGVSNRHFAEREFPSDQVNLFLAQNYARENSSLQVPARLGVTYWESTGIADIHEIDFERRTNRAFRPHEPDLNLMNISFNGRGSFGQVQNQMMNEVIHPKENLGKTSLNTGQPTMRLMGKDVAVGKSSKEMQGFEDGKVWTDKEIVVEHCRSGSGLDSPSPARNFQEWIPQLPSGKYKETLPQCLDIRSEKSAQNHLLIRAPGSGDSHPYLDWQTNDAFQSSSFASSRNHSPNLFPVAHVPAASTIFDGAPHFRDFFVSGAEPLPLSSQLPVLSTPRDSFEHLDWRPAEITHRQNLPHFSKPGFEFPFLNPDSRANHVQSPWFQNSKSLPSWLLHAKQQGKTPIISSQPITITTSKQPQHISSRTNILNTPSVYHSAEAATYSRSPGTRLHPQANSSFGSASISLPPFVPVIAAVQPASTISSTGFRNRMKVKERLKSKALGIKDLYPCKKTNKKIVAKSSVDLVNPATVLNLQRHEMSSAMTRSTENLSCEIPCDMGTDGISGAGYCYSTETQNNGMRNSGNEYSKVDGMGRSGPIKLSAGAKHILKPNQNLDLVDNFVPIHSTIPFSGASTCVSRVPNEPEKKATKIYRF